ncbi:hypothetical protein CLU79DRAFT_763993 [Phycomyces nitens]|nr:hypothetical protein CLU79DRAFT_763993 [Phycomyces nitens]
MSTTRAPNRPSLADFTTETRQTTGEIPPVLVGASTTFVNNAVYVFGGRLASNHQITNHLYILNLNTYVWSHHFAAPDSAPPPQPRHFHSMSVHDNRYLVLFGGMGYASSKRRNEKNESILSLRDVCLFDTKTLSWIACEVQPSLFTPQARYAHLSVCANNKLIIMGGQDVGNRYVHEISVFDLTTHAWVQCSPIEKPYGTYRAIAFCPPTKDIAMLKSTLYYPEKPKKNLSITTAETMASDDPTLDADFTMCVYSNYNFTNVTRDLQLLYPLRTQSTVECHDRSTQMSGSVLPPGLRFPTGRVIGHHFILTGTYLSPTQHGFHIWALDLVNLTWKRIDAGSALDTGSWNHGFLHEDRRKIYVFGNKHQDLLKDYHGRRMNFDHLTVVDLESYGIYPPPHQIYSSTAQTIGLEMLKETLVADTELLTSDNVWVPVNSAVLSCRWPFFAKLMSLEDPRDHSSQDRSYIRFPENHAVAVAFLQFIYTGHLKTAQQQNPQILARLLILADMYQVPRLKELATHSMHQNLTITTARLVYETAALTYQISLQVRALRVMLSSRKALFQAASLSGGLGLETIDSNFLSSPSNGPMSPGYASLISRPSHDDTYFSRSFSVDSSSDETGPTSPSASSPTSTPFFGIRRAMQPVMIPARSMSTDPSDFGPMSYLYSPRRTAKSASRSITQPSSPTMRPVPTTLR